MELQRKIVLKFDGEADVVGYLQSIVPQHKGHQKRKHGSVCLQTLEPVEDGLQAGPTCWVTSSEMVPMAASDLPRKG